MAVKYEMTGRIAGLERQQEMSDNLAEYRKLEHRLKAADRAVALANAELRAAQESFSAYIRRGKVA